MTQNLMLKLQFKNSFHFWSVLCFDVLLIGFFISIYAHKFINVTLFPPNYPPLTANGTTDTHSKHGNLKTWQQLQARSTDWVGSASPLHVPPQVPEMLALTLSRMCRPFCSWFLLDVSGFSQSVVSPCRLLGFSSLRVIIILSPFCSISWPNFLGIWDSEKMCNNF